MLSADPLRVLFGASPAVVAKTCRQLRESVAGLDRSPRKVSLYEQGAVERVVRALERLPTNPEVQGECAWFLALLADHQPDPSSKRKISLGVGKSGAIEAALAAMRRFPADGDVQEGCSLLFGCLSDDTPENRLALAQHGAHKLSAKAAQHFPERWGIWGGLVGMSSEPSVAQYMCDRGMVDHVRRVARSNRTRGVFRVRTEALRLLAVMSRSAPDSVDGMVRAGLIRQFFLNLRDEPTAENFNDTVSFLEAVVDSSTAGRAHLLRHKTLSAEGLLSVASRFPLGSERIGRLARRLGGAAAF